MKALKLICAAAGLVLTSVAAAHAAPAFSTANVNMRTGPDTDFPSVGVIPDGDPVEVAGCLRDESWCDVIWGPERGWVYSEYLAFERRGEYVSLLDVDPVEFRIPFVTFAARDYWDRYYVGRPWYAERSRWYAFNVRPRIGWRAPPRGPRVPGWWRAGYRTPSGMVAPAEHWRRAERRHDRRDDRREDRREDRRDWRRN